MKTKLDFKVGSVEDLSHVLPEGEKADLFLVRNVLYHVMGYPRTKESDKTASKIIGQINETLNTGGLVVFDKFDTESYANHLMQKGFEPVIFDKTTKNEAKLDNPETLASRANVWRKVRDI